MMKDTPVKALCVLVLEHDILLKRAIASIMTLGEELDVVVSEAADLQELMKDILIINPDIVLMGDSLVVAGNIGLSELLKADPKLRVILVSEDSNWLHIFRREDRHMTQLEDLVASIYDG